MPAYFDSNILISILQNDAQAEEAAALWENQKEKISSVLFEIECLTVLRRLSIRFQKQLPGDWFLFIHQKLINFLGQITLKEVDASIVEMIRQRAELSDCRSLDAVHVATALHFKQAAQEPYYFCTFDQRMAETARKVGFEVLPA